MTDRMTCAEVRAAHDRISAEINALMAEADGLSACCLHDETTTQPLDYQGTWVDVVVCAACRTYLGEAPHACAILTALDAADAQGYARAMGEVVERCEATVTDNAKGRRWDPYTMGLCDEMDRVADWARERLPAAAEKEHGG